MLACLSGLALFYGVSSYRTGEVVFIEWEIAGTNRASIIITLLMDWMRSIFMGLVMMISSMVLFYSYAYIAGDKFMVRFIILVYLFVLSIIFLIVRPNIIRILLGWDGLGLVSYCLVIYYQNTKSANAGMVTILSNRVGDVAILLRIAWLLNYGGWNFYYLQFIKERWELSFLVFMVVLAAMTKRAQIPFSAWLPAAIAAPTPVSALVHSSTLVTAGVYLLIRFHRLLEFRQFLLFVGALTIFMSGLGANFENDLKKIIALSTLRQLGLIMITLGVGAFELSFFHLLTHAMFKSLLFLCAGVFIHSMGDVQDIRSLGGLFISCPVSSLYFIGASMALCGFPFLSGFYSKDLILELYFLLGANFIMWVVVGLATMFTLSYSVRLLYYMFFKNLGPKKSVSLGEEVKIIVPMRVLAGLMVFAGGLIRMGNFPLVLIYLTDFMKLSVIVGLTVTGLMIYVYINIGAQKVSSPFFFAPYFIGSMWFLPQLTSLLFMPLLKIGEEIYKFSDQGWVEYSGGQGAVLLLRGRAVSTDMFNLVNLKFYVFTFFCILMFAVWAI
jgi:NADH-ubiquinone oxidoreductase chain 5